MFSYKYTPKDKRSFGDFLKKIYRNKYHHLYKGVLTHKQKDDLADKELYSEWDIVDDGKICTCYMKE